MNKYESVYLENISNVRNECPSPKTRFKQHTSPIFRKFKSRSVPAWLIDLLFGVTAFQVKRPGFARRRPNGFYCGRRLFVQQFRDQLFRSNTRNIFVCLTYSCWKKTLKVTVAIINSVFYVRTALWGINGQKDDTHICRLSI